jgi:hypothetical protein
MYRGKRRKAREGKMVAGPRPGYGFRFDKNKVYETMHRRVFVHLSRMTDGENHRDLLTRLSKALALTEAAYLEAPRRRDL